MLIPNHLVIPDSLAATSLEFAGECVIIHARTTSDTARCPTCQTPSRRVHSHYTRTLADLPWAGLPVSFQVVVRRFRCPEPDCSQIIFAERLGEMAQTYARRMSRQQQWSYPGSVDSLSLVGQDSSFHAAAANSTARS